MTAPDAAVQAHMAAALTMLDHILAGTRAEDPESAAGIDKALKAGAMLTLHSTFAPGTRYAALAVDLVEPTGNTTQVFRCELQPREPS